MHIIFSRRYETSSVGTHREQDFGYEVIDQTAADISQIQDDIDMMPEEEELDGLTPTLPPKQKARGRRRAPDEDEEELVGQQYRGTPERSVPSRNRRRQQQQQQQQARSPVRAQV